MYTIEVTHNGGAPIIAGGETLDQIYINLSCVRDAGGQSGPAERITLGARGLRFPVLANRGAGLEDWLDGHLLQVGDVVVFSLHEGGEPTPAVVQPSQQSNDSKERLIFEVCKQNYFFLRAKYPDLEGVADDWVKDRD